MKKTTLLRPQFFGIEGFGPTHLKPSPWISLPKALSKVLKLRLACLDETDILLLCSPFRTLELAAAFSIGSAQALVPLLGPRSINRHRLPQNRFADRLTPYIPMRRTLPIRAPKPAR